MRLKTKSYLLLYKFPVVTQIRSQIEMWGQMSHALSHEAMAGTMLTRYRKPVAPSKLFHTAAEPDRDARQAPKL